MSYVLLASTVSIVIGVLSFFVVRQYHRVQKRDAHRRRIQTYQSSASHSSSFPNDPLDHSLYWYPVAFSKEIPYGSRRPFAFHLLNEPLCLYRRNDGEVICVLDLCPHRSAPLSLGQITKEGNPECMYHGWQYGAKGQCVYIPSVSKQSNTATLICARTKPVHEQYGYIWIWPGKAELAHSDLIPHRLFADLQKANGNFLLSPEEVFSFDIPYDLMVDNLLDMAHIDFTHDGTIGKRSLATFIHSEQISPSPFFSTNSESVTYKLTKPEQKDSRLANNYSNMSFIPPCFVCLEHYISNGKSLILQTFIILPSGQNKMRLLLQFYRNFFSYKWLEYIPGYDYLAHRMVKKIVDQDLLLLNGVDRNIAQMGAKPLGTLVSADAPIKAFRQFYSRALTKYQTIYVKRGAWSTTKISATKSSTKENDDFDIEDLKFD